MGGVRGWQQLDLLRQIVRAQPGVELWLFGSALTSLTPGDLDVLLLYQDLRDIETIRSAHPWEDEIPPIHITAMTRQEESDYGFIRGTRARRLV